jgi:hypothetical protein
VPELVDEDPGVRVAKAIYQQEVALLPFKEQEDGRKVSFLKGGKVVLVDKSHVDDVKAGEWWFVQLAHKETFAVAIPIQKFDPEDYFDASPGEKERVLRVLRGEEAPPMPPAASVRHEPPRAVPRAEAERHPVVVTGNGTIELGEFAPHFREGAEVLVDRRRNVLALRPVPSGTNSFAVEDGVVVARTIGRSLVLPDEGTYTGVWDARRGMVIVELPVENQVNGGEV